MSDLLVLCAFLASAAFLVIRQQKYAALAIWSCIVLNLWSELPAYLAEQNFLYPLIALLSLPFLAVTAGHLLNDNETVLQLSRAAAIATVIWVPFALLPPLRDALIAAVVTLVFLLVTVLGSHPQLVAWDVIAENGFSNQIIPGCTGILAAAVMLGVVFSEKGLTARQAAAGFLLVVPPVLILNLLRVAVVFIAVSGRWFAGFPDPTGTGDANFFYAHNVAAEAIAVLFLFLLAGALVRVIPRLGVFFRALFNLYFGRLRRLALPQRDTPRF